VGAQARIACTPDDPEVAAVTMQYFADSDAMRDAWSSDVAVVEPALEETDTACDGAEPGYRRWGWGYVSCHIEDDTAIVTWTDQRTQTFGIVQGTDDDLEALHGWWQRNARPLGRGIDVGGGDREQPSQPTRPFVRVPGPPGELVCVGTAEPIPDEWDRTWRIRNIEFLDRGDFERVILNLRRVGRNRQGQPTQATVEHMPVAQVRRSVPNASRPERGAIALVVRLDGVREAPDLRRYRPSSTTLVREMSVVPGQGTRTVVLSVTEDTCYQMRIPVWGASASGKERTAEVYIDLREESGG